MKMNNIYDIKWGYKGLELLKDTNLEYVSDKDLVEIKDKGLEKFLLDNNYNIVNEMIDEVGYATFVKHLIMFEKNVSLDLANSIFNDYMDRDYITGIFSIEELFE